MTYDDLRKSILPARHKFMGLTHGTPPNYVVLGLEEMAIIRGDFYYLASTTDAVSIYGMSLIPCLSKSFVGVCE